MVFISTASIKHRLRNITYELIFMERILKLLVLQGDFTMKVLAVIYI